MRDSRPDTLHTMSHPETDPFEAIYALNIGDFVAENFISDDLLTKITMQLGDDPGKLSAQLEELVRIYALDQCLGILGFESHEGFIIYDSVAATLCQMMDVDACHVFQKAAKNGGESVLSLTGTSLQLGKTSRWEIGIPLNQSDLLADVFEGDETTSLQLSKQPTRWRPIAALSQEKRQSILAAPMQDSGRSVGLMLFESDTPLVFSEEQLQLAEVSARLMVTTLRLQDIIAQTQQALNKPAQGANASSLLNLRAQLTESIADLGDQQQGFLVALSHCMDARNHFTQGHSRMVSCIVRQMAEQMALNEKTTDLVAFAGLLGSIGKYLTTPESIARAGRLNTDEWDAIRNHPNVGVSLLGKINFLSEVRPYVQSQKEHWDGSGSPEGLQGRSIPLGSRLLAVADAYVAMTQDRPYRQEPMDHAAAMAALQSEAGSKWDPDVVDALSALPESVIQSCADWL
ncbi:MAG: HD domain-containing phosphohydrolase [Candidatus Melainabacteria bacterium]